MRKAGIIMIIAGIIIVIAGTFFFHDINNAADSMSMSVTPGGTPSSRWPIFFGAILVFVGCTFYMSERKNSNMQH